MFQRTLLCSALALLGLTTALAAQDQPRQKNPAQKSSDRDDARGGEARDQGQRELSDLNAFLKKYDKNNDGAVDRKELPASLRDHFEILDRDNNGKLSREELQQHAARMARRLQPSQVTYIWLMEIEPAVKTGKVQPNRQNIQQAYDMLRKIDRDNDGTITDDELSEARRKHMKEHINALIKECDEDNDGKISMKEAQGHVLDQYFSRFDTNNDNQISREELMQAATRSTRDAERGTVQPKQQRD